MRSYENGASSADGFAITALKWQEFLAEHALFRAEPFPVEKFSLVASYLTKAGSIYEDQADYGLG